MLAAKEGDTVRSSPKYQMEAAASVWESAVPCGTDNYPPENFGFVVCAEVVIGYPVPNKAYFIFLATIE